MSITTPIIPPPLTRLIYRSPSGRVEVAKRGGKVVISVLNGTDSLDEIEVLKLVRALNVP